MSQGEGIAKQAELVSKIPASPSGSIETWLGPTGPIDHNQVDDVFVAAVYAEGAIPATVEMDPDTHTVVISALGVLGFAKSAARAGSSMAARKKAGLTGPSFGADVSTAVVLTDELTTARHLTKGMTIPGAVTAAATESHIRARGTKTGQAAKKVLKRLALGIIGTDFSHLTPEVDPKEMGLQFVTRRHIIAAYQSEEHCNFGTTAAPLLLSLAIERLGNRMHPHEDSPERIRPEIATASRVIKLFQQLWQANRKHVAGIPEIITAYYKTSTYEQVMITRDARLAGRQKIADMQHDAREEGRRIRKSTLSEAGVNAVKEYYERHTDERIAMTAIQFALNLGETRRMALQKKKDAYQAAIEKERSDERKETYRIAASVLYNSTALQSTETLRTLLEETAETGDHRTLLRVAMSLYERGRMGDGAAAELFDAFRHTHEFSMLAVGLGQQTNKMSEGRIRPEEALFIADHIMGKDLYSASSKALQATLVGALIKATYSKTPQVKSLIDVDDAAPKYETVDSETRYSMRARKAHLLLYTDRLLMCGFDTTTYPNEAISMTVLSKHEKVDALLLQRTRTLDLHDRITNLSLDGKERKVGLTAQEWRSFSQLELLRLGYAGRLAVRLRRIHGIIYQSGQYHTARPSVVARAIESARVTSPDKRI